jgi:tight adherence protein B
MSALLLFGLLFILSFVVLFYVFKPTRAESAVQRHLEGIEGAFTPSADPSSILKEEKLSALPWVSDLLRTLPATFALLHLIKQAGSSWKVAPVLLYTAVVALLTIFLAILSAPNFGAVLCVGVGVALLPFVYLYIARMARFRRCTTLLPEAVDLMSRAMKAGHTVTSALEMVGKEIGAPLAAEFRTACEEQTLGLPLRDAILGLVHRLPIEDMRFLATAILVQKETGGNLTQILDKTAVVMRERARLYGQLRIYTAQGRITGWILCSLPFVLFLLLNFVNHEYESILFTDPLGIKLIYTGLAMMLIGILVIRKIIRIRV